MYVGRRRLIWAHILAQEGLYEPHNAYAPEGLYGHQEAYMGPHMGPRRLNMGTRRLICMGHIWAQYVCKGQMLPAQTIALHWLGAAG